MKILLTMNLPYFPATGGANKANRLLIEMLARRGHTVRAVVPALGTPARHTHAEFLEQLNAARIHVNSRTGLDLFNIDGVEVHAVTNPAQLRSRLVEQIEEFAPDRVVVSSEDPSQSLLEAAVRSAPSRVVYIVHTPTFLPFGPQSFFPSRRRSQLFTPELSIVSVSRFVRQYVRQWSGLDSTVIYMPVYGEPPFPILGSFDNPFVTIVNPCQVKGISIFLALARVLPEVAFAAVPSWGTTTDDYAALEKLENVRLLPSRPDFEKILAQTRVLLMPSLWQEAFGLTAVEAMLRGIPVVSSDAGGLAEAKLGTRFVIPVRPIEHFGDELDSNQIPVPVVPPQDLNPWRDALTNLLTDRDLYGRESAASRATSSQFVAQLSIEPLEELLRDGRAKQSPRQPAATASEAGAAQHADISTDDNAATRVSPPLQVDASKTDTASAAIAELTPEQRALLMLRLRKKASLRTGETKETQVIPRAPREGNLPLSFAQQRLWFLDQLEPGTASYNLPVMARLTGNLNVDALSKALETVVHRHDSLRTSFSESDGQPSQLIHPPAPLTLSLLDFSHLPPHERQHQTDLLIATQSSLPFDLSLYPLWRATLLRLDSREHLLLFVIHHIISDGWSMGVLVRELASAYASFTAAESPSLPPLPIQYADFAVWQREWLAGARLAEQLDYWRGQLAGAAPVLELPTDHSRPAVQGYRGARVEVGLDAELTLRLEELSREEGATLFMTLLGAFRVLLWRYSGQEDVSIGTPIAGRTQLQTEGLIGFFINTLVLRVEVRGDESFRELVSRERESALGGYGHQEVPFERLVEEMGVERDMSHTPLFQVMFVLESKQPQHVEMKLEGLELRAVEAELKTAKFDLTLALRQNEAGAIVGAVEYNTDLFEQSTIQQLARHFERIAETVTHDPDVPLERIQLLSEQERRLQLEQWNNTAHPYERACLHHLIEAQAARTPDATALVFEGQRLSYAELNRRANQLARHLRTLGVGAEVAVGLMTQRSIEMLVALLGLLKAGGAYVPLDPSYPRERLDFMLHDAGVNVLLTQESLRANVPVGVPETLRVVALDAEHEQLSGYSGENLSESEVSVTPDNLAYLIYTSGSTGQPKGVLVSHRSVSNYLAWAVEAYALYAPAPAHAVDDTPTSGAPLHSSLSFDLSVTALFAPLVCGHSVHLVSEDVGVEALAASLSRAPAYALVKLTPSHLELLSQRLPSGAASSAARSLVIGGEALTWEALRYWRESAPQTRLFNEYGPTEATVGCTIYEVRWDDPVRDERAGYAREEGSIVGDSTGAKGGRSGEQERSGAQPQELARQGGVPIGRPIQNTQVYVLDERMELVPVGVRGELYVGGECLARGYQGRAEQTAERFVPHPFSRRVGGGERLYRTGDVVRYLGDGNMEYVGRNDGQVKVRGYRVELGEIEAVVRGAEGVGEAVVLMREGMPGDVRLVAYVVMRRRDRAEAEGRAGGLREEQGEGQGQAGREIGETAEAETGAVGKGEGGGSGEDEGRLSEEEEAGIRGYVSERLPEAMRPWGYVGMVRMPLTANGKVDRRALPALKNFRTAAESPYVISGNPVEEMLSGIWEEVLGVEQIGINDNFFSLGGHSLLAVRVMAQVREVLKVEMPLRSFFEFPTVAGLSRRIQSLLSESQELHSTPIEPTPRDAPIPLSYAQNRRWLQYRWAGERSAYFMPSHAKLTYRMRGVLNVEALEESMREVVRRHEILRTILPEVDGRPVQLIAPASVLNPRRVDLRELPDDVREVEALRIVADEHLSAFELGKGPLLRATLIRLGEEEHLAVIVLDHLIFDGWSAKVLLKELTTLYEAFSAGEPSPLPELSIQYADFAIWQRERLSGETLERHLEFWKALFDGDSPVHEMQLPSMYPEPPIIPHARMLKGAIEYLMLSPAFSKELKALSRRQNVTLFMFFMAAFKMLMHRYTGQEHIGVISPTANRNRLETHELIGWFSHALPYHTDLSGNPTFTELLKRTREMVLQVAEHQEMPLDKLIEVLEPENYGKLTTTPYVWFEVVNAVDAGMETSAEMKTSETETVVVDDVPVPTEFSTTPGFSLDVIERLQGFEVQMQYEAARFDASAIRQMLSDFQSLLESIVADPEQRVSTSLQLTESL